MSPIVELSYTPNYYEIDMRRQLEQRLQQLKTEYESGQKVLADLAAKKANVQSTLLRIQGAIQVLEEELAKVDESGLIENNADAPPIEVVTNGHD